MLPTFLINLDRSPDRLAHMQAQAARIGLAFERFAAVDGVNMPKQFRSQFIGVGSWLSAGEIGCYASHLCLHERIVREQIPYALILEDDVDLEDDLLTAVNEAIAAAPAGWDYIHLSGHLKRPVLSVEELSGHRHLVRHWQLPVNTGGYLISLRGAEKMLAAGPRLRPIDQEVRHAWCRDLDVLGVYPSPVIWSDKMPTTIDGTWRTEAKPKRRWSTGPGDELQGLVYTLRKLGPGGALRCFVARLMQLRGQPRRPGDALIGRLARAC